MSPPSFRVSILPPSAQVLDLCGESNKITDSQADVLCDLVRKKYPEKFWFTLRTDAVLKAENPGFWLEAAIEPLPVS